MINNKRFIYLMQSTRTSEYKIGVSNKPEKRKKELETGHGAPIIILKTFYSSFPFVVEAMLHQYFRESRRDGEFFNLFDDEVKLFNYLCETYEELVRIKLSDNDYL